VPIDGPQYVLASQLRERAAQSANRDVDDATVELRAAAPDPEQQQVSRYDLLGMREHEFQQTLLDRSQCGRAHSLANGAGIRIDLQSGKLVRMGCERQSAAKSSTHPCDQLFRNCWPKKAVAEAALVCSRRFCPSRPFGLQQDWQIMCVGISPQLIDEGAKSLIEARTNDENEIRAPLENAFACVIDAGSLLDYETRATQPERMQVAT
jgi:hypothetical protein